MARQFTMGAQLNLNTSSYSNGMADAIRETNRFAQSASGAESAMSSYANSHNNLSSTHNAYTQATQGSTLANTVFTQTMRGAAVGAAALATAIGTVTTAAVTMASEVDVAQGQIQAMTGVTEAEAIAMTGAARDVYRSGWGQSLPQIASDMAIVKQNVNDLSNEAMAAFTESAYVVEKAFQAPVEETTRTVGNMMDVFEGLGHTEAFDLITAGIQRTGAESGDFLGTLNEYSVFFDEMGFSAEQMVGGFVAGAENGVFMIDKVGDSVKEGFLQMQTSSDPVREAYQAMGLDASMMGEQIAMGGETATGAFQATLMGLSKLQGQAQNDAGVALFGSQWEDVQSKAMFAIGAGMKGLDDFSGATALAAAALSDNLGFKMTALGNSFKDGLGEIGTPIVDSLKMAANWAITNLPMVLGGIEKVASVVGSVMVPAFNLLKPVFSWLMNAFQVVSPYILGVGAALFTLGAYFKLVQLRITLMATVMKGLFLLMNMNPITLIAIGVGLLIGYLINLAGGWGVVKQKIVEFLPTLRMIGTTIMNMIMPVLRSFGTLFMAVFNGIRTYILPVVNQIIFGIVAGFRGLVGFIQEHSAVIMGIITIAWAVISAHIATAISLVSTIITVGFEVISTAVSVAWSFIELSVKNAWAVISGLLSAGLKVLQGDWSGAWDSMVGILGDVWSNVTGFFSKLTDLFYSSGKKIIETLVDGIKSMASAPVKAIEDVLGAVRDYLPFSDAKTGPLSQLTHNGGKIITTMAEGIYKQKGALASAMDHVLMRTPKDVQIQPSFAGLDSLEMNKPNTLVSFMDKTLIDLPAALVGAMSKAFMSIPDTLASTLSGMPQIGLQVPDLNMSNIDFQTAPTYTGDTTDIQPGTINPAGSTGSRTVNAQKSVMFGDTNIHIHGAENKNAKELALEVVDELVDLLKEADEIESIGLGDLL